MNKYQSQQAQILEHLQTLHSITTLEARENLFIMSPASRVFELKERGFNIITQRVGKSRIARYVLLSSEVRQ
jgi:hypothetical protein